MRRSSRKSFYSRIYIFILCFSSVLAISDPGLYVKSAQTYNDSLILLHMEKQKPIDDSSLDNYFIIRIIDSINPNFVYKNHISDEDINEAENIFTLTNGYILLTYYKINDTNRYGMICNPNGEILSKSVYFIIYIYSFYIQKIKLNNIIYRTKGLILGGSKDSSSNNVIININSEVGFLWLTNTYDPQNGITNILWIAFSMP